MIWYRHHADWKVCGIVYIDATSVQPRRLRQLGLEAHTSIIASATRTTLKQTFVSPASWSQPSQQQQPELRYQFPLHDGVSVVAFTCTIGDKDPRVIRGVVREREEARDIYNDAVQQGRTAGLMEQLPEAADVFTTRLGNIPPATRVVVEITYLGELKHDAQSDGLRLTIPMAIAPRYGSYPGDLDTAAAQGSLSSSGSEGGLKITVDAQLPASSQIQSIQSPSHQIAVSIGKTSTSPSTQALSFSQASATLALANTTSLEKDFILNLTATNLSSPQAILERHPTIPNQHALMTTLVPKFTLPAPKTPPEFVFVCDRSGSMHDKIINLISALRIFIKSLPRGALFNICSFGSRFQFLWPAGSQPYTRDTVAQAMAHVESFSANFGGTEMYQPLEATFKLRRAGSSLEVFLLTDGEIWDQQNLIRMVQEQVSQSAGAIRVFSLGIGDGASSSLVEGVARAGNGFAQTVVDGEDMSGKVVRMVKGAMFQHVEDYQLEVKYGADTTVTISANTEAGDGDGDDDFEIVEKVVDALVIGDGDDAAPPYSEKSATRSTEDKKPAKASLFDVSVEISADIPTNNIPSAKDRFAHLPACPPPNILQTPIKIPQLFPFNRTTVYLLLNTPFPTGKETGSALAPKSVVLRATAPDGTPLELEITVTVLPEAGETIHQLAAKKAVQELEEGKGWIYHAKRDEKFDTSKNTKDAGKKTALKDQYPEHIFNDMAKREAVRLGVTFQVGSGKWCSFIAVGDDDGDDSNNENAANTSSPQPDLEIAPKPAMASVGPCRSSAPPARFASSRARCNIAPPGSSAASSFGNSSADFCVMPTSNSSLPPLPPPPAPAPAATLGRRKGSRGMLGVSMAQADESASAYESAPAAPAPPGASAQLYGGGPFASTSINYAEQKKTGGSWLAKMLPRSHKSSHVSTASASTAAEAGNYAPRSYTGMGLSMKKLSKRVSSSSHSERAEWGDEDEDEESHTAEATLPTDKLDALVLLQTFDATWLWADVLKLMGWTEQQVLAAWTETSGAGKSRLAAPGGIGEGLKEPAKDLFATALVVVWLRSKMTGQKDAWELLAEKAIERLGDDDAKVLLKTADEEVDGLLAGAAGVVGRLAEL